jgi:ElaA protein
MTIIWRWLKFADLTASELYDIISLREAIFVVEQICPYLDADGLDKSAYHLIGSNQADQVVAYLRLLPPGIKFSDPGLGRIVVALEERRRGIGEGLIGEGLRKARELYPGRSVHISAQQRLQQYYEKFGFNRITEIYDEDGIPHIEMVCNGNQG